MSPRINPRAVAAVVVAGVVVFFEMRMAAAQVQAQTQPQRSGLEFMSSATQALQKDDSLNPGMLWVGIGEDQWRAAAGTTQRSCAGCHGDARQSMRGVAARYPAFDAALGRPLSLAMRINQCRSQRRAPQRWPRKASPCWRWKPTSRISRAACPSRRPWTSA